MLKKILLPLDGSVEAESPLPYIKDFTHRFNSKLHILGVAIGSKRRKVNQLLTDYIQETAANLNREGLPTKAHIRYGHAGEQILSFAKENAVDSIVMATHGRSGISRWWIGSLAENIIAESTIPVLLTRSKQLKETEVNKSKTFQHMLVPLDGSNISESALHFTESIALKLGASISLLHIVHSFNSLGFDIPGYDLKIMNRKMNDAGKRYLKNISERLHKKGIESTSKVMAGNAASAIIEYTKEKKVDLIIMSTHGRSGIARWILGSVAEKVLRESTLPLWLVRSPEMLVEKNSI